VPEDPKIEIVSSSPVIVIPGVSSNSIVTS
jgi:hypothetical protein